MSAPSARLRMGAPPHVGKGQGRAMSGSVLIVDRGRACGGIVCADLAHECLGYARGELRRFIAEKTGCTLPDGELDGRAIRLEAAISPAGLIGRYSHLKRKSSLRP